jgi:translation initiation factor 3 subunit C
MAGALAMKVGDWRTCESHVLSLSIWSLCTNADAVRNMLRQKIKEESLRTYLFAFSGFYDSMSLLTLSYVIFPFLLVLIIAGKCLSCLSPPCTALSAR